LNSHFVIQFLINLGVLSLGPHENWNLQDPAEELEPDVDDTEHDLFGTQSDEANQFMGPRVWDTGFNQYVGNGTPPWQFSMFSNSNKSVELV
jgi:hypothetical protein